MNKLMELVGKICDEHVMNCVVGKDNDGNPIDDKYNVKAVYAEIKDIADELERNQWVSVKDRLPETGQVVLACYKNRANRDTFIKARYIHRFTEEVSGESDDDCEFEYKDR